MIFNKSAVRLLLTFYRNFFMLSLILSLSLAYAFLKSGAGFPAGIVLFKLTSLWLICYFLSAFKKKEWYYFRNSGYSISGLFLTSFCIDLLLFLLFLYLVTFLR